MRVDWREVKAVALERPFRILDKLAASLREDPTLLVLVLKVSAEILVFTTLLYITWEAAASIRRMIDNFLARIP